VSDWAKLNACRILPSQDEDYGSTSADGFNGAFWIRLNGLKLLIIASDGYGWQHVSVSIAGSDMPPSWSIMCQVKDLFWDPEDWVVQYHPANSQYVNNHPGVLHLWRPTSEKLPTPPSILVGIK